jgi:hypothetical protein
MVVAKEEKFIRGGLDGSLLERSYVKLLTG